MPPYTRVGRSRFLRNYSNSVSGYTMSKLRSIFHILRSNNLKHSTKFSFFCEYYGDHIKEFKYEDQDTKFISKFRS